MLGLDDIVRNGSATVSDNKTTVRAVRRDKPEAARSWQLRVTEGKATGRVLPLSPGEFVIGRDEDAALRLEDSGVSRRHAKVVHSGDDTVVLVDLDSTNGTWVNDARIELSALHAGYRVRIGPDVQLIFEARVESTASPSVPHLTARELEVARLVAAGLSNPEIAKRLAIRPRTVATHLENVYRRLGIGSRAELARHLGERGLA
jgi:DNA-binding CsgD family transcriptional regulator